MEAANKLLQNILPNRLGKELAHNMLMQATFARNLNAARDLKGEPHPGVADAERIQLLQSISADQGAECFCPNINFCEPPPGMKEQMWTLYSPPEVASVCNPAARQFIDEEEVQHAIRRPAPTINGVLLCEIASLKGMCSEFADCLAAFILSGKMLRVL